MANYRFYVLDKDDHVREPPQVFECRTDEVAVEKAVQLLNGRVIEVWDHSRRVVRLEPTAKRQNTFLMLDTPPGRSHGRGGDLQSQAYDSDDLRLLSAARSAALAAVRKSAGGPLTETEISDFSERIAASPFRAFNSGERDPAALNLAALQGILTESGIKLYS